PANAAFAGDIEVLALDDAARRLQLLGKGADRGGSSASMDLTATIEPGDTAEQSVLVGQAAVIVNGKFASFGGRLMGQVSDLLLAQFADNFRGVAAALPATASAGDVPAAAPAGLPAAAAPAAPTATAAIAATTAMVATTSTTSTTSTAAAGTPAPPTDTSSLPAPPASELNALSLAWGLIKNFFASLFGKRSA
ncbi:MAG: CoxG family protein, partial [Lautropia sp.]